MKQSYYQTNKFNLSIDDFNNVASLWAQSSCFRMAVKSSVCSQAASSVKDTLLARDASSAMAKKAGVVLSRWQKEVRSFKLFVPQAHVLLKEKNS